ncbi:MAG: DUF2284 domain-containing protein [Candidatus Methanofastidiosa archaeon]|nr:DUF2284 domain-containing protein [Candidatus Methanofastidiosa archaeon]
MMIPEKHRTILKERSAALGAKDQFFIPVTSIVVENRTILKCIFGCNGYGNRVCPPYIPTVDEFRKMLSEYEWALLVEWKSINVFSRDISENFTRFKTEPPKDLETKKRFEEAVKTIIRERYEIIQPGVLELEKLAWSLGYNMALATFPGMCVWCANDEYTSVECTGESGACRYPNIRRPCLMGLGIRMDKTLTGLGIQFKSFPMDNIIPSQYTLLLLD